MKFLSAFFYVGGTDRIPAQPLGYLIIGLIQTESSFKEMLERTARVTIIYFQFFARFDLLECGCECRGLCFSGLSACSGCQQISSFTILMQPQKQPACGGKRLSAEFI